MRARSDRHPLRDPRWAQCQHPLAARHGRRAVRPEHPRPWTGALEVTPAAKNRPSVAGPSALQVELDAAAATQAAWTSMPIGHIAGDEQRPRSVEADGAAKRGLPFPDRCHARLAPLREAEPSPRGRAQGGAAPCESAGQAIGPRGVCGGELVASRFGGLCPRPVRRREGRLRRQLEARAGTGRRLNTGRGRRGGGRPLGRIRPTRARSGPDTRPWRRGFSTTKALASPAARPARGPPASSYYRTDRKWPRSWPAVRPCGKGAGST